MRIRRRPPGQPLGYLLPTSDPPTAPLRASRDHPAGDRQEEKGELHLHPHPRDVAADLGDSRSSSAALTRPALLPQDGVVECSRGLAAQQQGPADARGSLENNGHHRHVPESVTIQEAGVRRLSSSASGGGKAVAVTTTTTAMGAKKKTQRGTKGTSTGGGGMKRAPRVPGVLLEGSRCSRQNGRGWQCSQPTLMGYALCQYHLGKGRMRSGTATAGGRGPGQLGHTEHGSKTTAAAAAPANAAPNKAAVAPPPPSVQHC